MATVSYEQLLRQVLELDPSDLRRLLEDLRSRMEKGSPARHGRSILELEGLGREIWQGIDAQKYVERERSSWNG